MVPAWLAGLVRNALPPRRLRPAARPPGPLRLEPLEAREVMASPLAAGLAAISLVAPAAPPTGWGVAGMTVNLADGHTSAGLDRLLDVVGRSAGWPGGDLGTGYTLPASVPPPPAPVVVPGPPGGVRADAAAPPPEPVAPPATSPSPTTPPACPEPVLPPPAQPDPPSPSRPEPAAPSPARSVAPPDSPTGAPAAAIPPPAAGPAVAREQPPPAAAVAAADRPAAGSPPAAAVPSAAGGERGAPRPPRGGPAPPATTPADLAAATDGVLLQRFAAGRDQSAFGELVRRHGRTVQRVCERVLGDPDRARDASQATFLALARRAGGLDARDSLGGWLYRVAGRMALRCRAETARRLRAERVAADRPVAVAADALATLAEADARQAVREELHRLPDQYRVPLELCYLSGQTHAQVARAVGLPRGSVAKRIGEALDRLREGLAVRGFR